MLFSNYFQSFKIRFHPGILTSAAAIALTCAVSATAYYYRSRREVNDVMIFCKLQFNVFSYFDKLISFIEAAKSNVSVCMPSIHNPVIQGRLVELIKRKTIKARIIIDKSGYNNWTASLLKELSDAGAEIKWKDSNYKMQHKFCLVDEEFLMTGTLDWGNDLSFDNWNCVFVTNKQQLVDPVKKEFHQMWNDCQIRIEDAVEIPKAEPDDKENAAMCVDGDRSYDSRSTCSPCSTEQNYQDHTEYIGREMSPFIMV